MIIRFSLLALAFVALAGAFSVSSSAKAVACEHAERYQGS